MAHIVFSAFFAGVGEVFEGKEIEVPARDTCVRCVPVAAASVASGVSSMLASCCGHAGGWTLVPALSSRGYCSCLT